MGWGTWRVGVLAAGAGRSEGEVRSRGGRSPGGIAGQAPGMGRRVLLRERGTRFGTSNYNCGA